MMKSERVNVYKCLKRSANYPSVVVVTVTKVTVMVMMVMAAMAMVTMMGTVRQDRERCSTEDSRHPEGGQALERIDAFSQQSFPRAECSLVL